jgi:hypothetical protein
MTGVRSLVAGILLASLSMESAALAGDEDRKADDLKWARGVAADFLDAAFQGHLEQAEALVDPSLGQAFARQGDGRLREWLNNSIAIQGFRAPDLGAGEMSPDADEAVFRGSFRRDKAEFRFTLRVAKGKETGKWRVSHFRFGEKDDKDK